VVITRAPIQPPSCTTCDPSAPPPPVTSSVSAGLRSSRSTRPWYAVTAQTGIPPASIPVTAAGRLDAVAAGTSATSCQQPTSLGYAHTASPGANPVTPGPTRSTWPASSAPGVNGKPKSPVRPPTVPRSQGPSPAASTCTSSSPGPGRSGAGTSTTRRTSGPP
jgi:hypothetical protein